MDVVCFGPFEADLRTGELRRDGVLVGLQELPFRVLAALVSRPGQLLTRDDLRAQAWPAGVFVDFEHGLNKAVNKIRRALGDSAERPSYVETLPGRGYRFMAPVRGRRVPDRVASRAGCRLLWEGRTIALAEGEHLIGREPEAAVWVDSSTVSRRHARIVLSSGSATIEDLGSKNGTFIQGRRIVARAELADGDEIAVGSARMTFRSSTGGSTKTAASG